MRPVVFLLRMAPGILVSIVMTFESLTKGWLTLWAIPSLLVTIPILLTTQSRVIRLAENGRPPSRIRWIGRAQLAGFLASYVCLPGVGDSDEYAMFGFLWMKQGPLVDAMWFTSLAAAAVASLSTIAFLALRAKGHAH